MLRSLFAGLLLTAALGAPRRRRATTKGSAPSATHYDYHIIVLGDVHDDLEAIERLRRNLAASSRKYDMVLCTGDLTSMTHTTVSATTVTGATTTTENEFLGRAARVAAALEGLAPLVYFVAGALDPLGLYERPPTERPGAARNAHGVVEPVTRGLWVAGWGGAPAPFELSPSGARRAAANLTRPASWAAFPFPTAFFFAPEEHERSRRVSPTLGTTTPNSSGARRRCARR